MYLQIYMGPLSFPVLEGIIIEHEKLDIHLFALNARHVLAKLLVPLSQYYHYKKNLYPAKSNK